MSQTLIHPDTGEVIYLEKCFTPGVLLWPGQFVILGGSTACGKTTLLRQFRENIDGGKEAIIGDSIDLIVEDIDLYLHNAMTMAKVNRSLRCFFTVESWRKVPDRYLGYLIKLHNNQPAQYGSEDATANTMAAPEDASLNGEPRTFIRPGAAPTHDDVEGGKRWHYLATNGAKTDPRSYIYEHVAGGFGGECNNFIYPDGCSPLGPASKEYIEGRIEAELAKLGHSVLIPA